MRDSDRKKRNLIIVGLCSILMIMAVGFAVFSQQLQINSTSEVTSTWDVHIKDNGVSYKNAVSATSSLAEKTSALVATFACQLTTPGTSTISYDIVVENKGSLNAKLDSINLTGGNSAISVVTSPTNASLATSPIVLGPNDETIVTVVVSYNDIQTQPTGDGAVTNITAELNFSQTADAPSGITRIVYAYHTDSKCISGNGCVEAYGYSNILTNGVNDYTQLTSYQNGKTWFLKYELDENNEILNAWACGKYSFIDEPVCIRGGRSSFSEESEELVSDLGPIFTSHGGYCGAGDDDSYCSGDSLFVAYSYGDASAGDTGDCYVYYDDEVKCVE